MNVQKIKAALPAHGLDAVVIMSPQNRFYATGFNSSDGAVLISEKGAWLFADSRYIEAARKKAPEGVQVLLSTRENPAHRAIAGLISEYGLKNIGAEEGSLSHSDFLAYEKVFGVQLKAAQSLFTSLRAVKERCEVDSITEAQRIAERALDYVLGIIKPGISEREIAAELTYRMMLYGGEGNSFDPICVAGRKSSMPHGVPGDELVQAGDFVTMDFGCIKNGYCSDMTRTIAVGSATEEMRKVYFTVLEAQQAGIDAARAGATGADVHNAGAAVIAAAGYGEYFGHGFGHSVGIDIHELPAAAPNNLEPLPAGAVITAEPGIYLPDKFGVRIEDMLYVTETGCENLTRAPKDELIIV